jgi:hypothetical protein
MEQGTKNMGVTFKKVSKTWKYYIKNGGGNKKNIFLYKI